MSEKRPNASPPDSDRRLSQTEMALKLKKPDLMSVFEHQGDTLFEGLDTLVRNGLIYKHQSEAVKAIRRDLHTPTEGDYSNVSLQNGSRCYGCICVQSKEGPSCYPISSNIEATIDTV